MIVLETELKSNLYFNASLTKAKSSESELFIVHIKC